MSHAREEGSAQPVPVDSRDPIRQQIAVLLKDDSNRRSLQETLDAIANEHQLILFLHRFLLFNDALAARVPFLAGLIHLSSDLFVDKAERIAFCRAKNGRIAALVAEAARDEYQLTEERNLVHQYLAQEFFRGVIEHYTLYPDDLDERHPIEPAVLALLDEARTKFLTERAPDSILRALGFHVALESFAHEEFNVTDHYLRMRHPALVEGLSRPRPGAMPAYFWLSLHTVVEQGHFEAGLNAVEEAIAFYAGGRSKCEAEALILDGLRQFIDLQLRFYRVIRPSSSPSVEEPARSPARLPWEHLLQIDHPPHQ
jgi:hypothetical protein